MPVALYPSSNVRKYSRRSSRLFSSHPGGSRLSTNSDTMPRRSSSSPCSLCIRLASVSRSLGRYSFSPLSYLILASAHNWSRSLSSRSLMLLFGNCIPVLSGQNRLLPVSPLRKLFSFVVAKNTHWRGYISVLRPYAGRNWSTLLVINAFIGSTSAFLYTDNSPSSSIHTLCSCSMPLEPSIELNESENHTPPIFASNELLPSPSLPMMVST